MGGDTEQGRVKQRSARNAIELKALMKIVNGIRRDGDMFSKHIIVQDAGVIAVLLPKRDFGRNLVLDVGGPVSRLEERQDEILACIGEGIAILAAT